MPGNRLKWCISSLEKEATTMNTHLGQNFRRPEWGVSRLNGRTERRKCMSMVQELSDALMIDVFIKRM